VLTWLQLRSDDHLHESVVDRLAQRCRTLDGWRPGPRGCSTEYTPGGAGQGTGVPHTGCRLSKNFVIRNRLVIQRSRRL
jgi:hypothetical protein